MNVGNGFLAKTCENLHAGTVWQVLTDREQRKPVLVEHATEPQRHSALFAVTPSVSRHGEKVRHELLAS